LGEQIATVDQACEILGLRGAGNMATAAA
jgi:hypothetical protein